MRVSKLTLRNILGHEEFELNDLGDFTLIEGLNGQGKTSIVEAIRSVIGGGHDATLLRNGTDEGEIVLVLDDETEIRKRITEKGSNVTVRRPDVGQITAGQSFIRQLIDNIDPTDMLAERDEKRRTQFLLEALPLELDAEQLVAAVAGLITATKADFVGHPLEVLAHFHKRIYDERTGVNREAKSKQASIDQLSGSLAGGDDEDPSEEIAALEEERDALPGKVTEQVDLLLEQKTAVLDEIEAPYKERIQKLQDKIAEIQERIESIEAEMGSKTKALEEEHAAGISEVYTRQRVRTAEIKARLDALRAGADARAAAANTRKVVAGFKAEYAQLVEKSQKLTEALARIDALKLGLMKQMPIKGVEIIDGVIHEAGVPWPRINKANQVKIAINLAKLRAKELPLVPIDNIECLDGPTLEAFRRNAPKSGLQFVITKVRQDPNDRTPGLTITRDESAEAEEAIPA